MKNLEATQKLLDGFIPEQGITLVPPPGEGKGFWSGGSFATLTNSAEIYLYYRLRRPRSQPYEGHRGYRCGIARSTDGISFETIWSADKRAFGARSIEKGCMAQRSDGLWLLYVSYDNEQTERWQIDVMIADHPRSFDPTERRSFLTCDSVDAHDIKDPHVFLYNGSFAVFANNTAEIGPREETLVAKTPDGLSVSVIQKKILTPSVDKNAWDAYSARLTGILPLSDGFLMFYDGQRFGGEICEEDCGICCSSDLFGAYNRLFTEKPFRTGVRYLQGFWLGESLMLYYEFTLPSGAHELRVIKLKS